VLFDLQIFCNILKFIVEQITLSQFSLLIYNFFFVIIIIGILSWFLLEPCCFKSRFIFCVAGIFFKKF